MDVIKHQDTFYLNLKQSFFIWDSSWDLWRPITSIGWNGKEITYTDYEYKKDIFNEWYGFNCKEMKDLCINLTKLIDKTKFTENIDLLFLKKEVFFDRKIEFLNVCNKNNSLKSIQSWKLYLKYLGLKNKTLRTFHDTKKTKKRIKSL